MVKGKRNGLTFTKCSVKICRFLPLLPTFKMKPLHCNAIAVCIPSARRSIDRLVMSHVTKQGYKNKWRRVVLKKKTTTNRIGVKRWNMVWLAVNLSSSALPRFYTSLLASWVTYAIVTVTTLHECQRQVQGWKKTTNGINVRLTNTSTLFNTAKRKTHQKSVGWILVTNFSRKNFYNFFHYEVCTCKNKLDYPN